MIILIILLIIAVVFCIIHYLFPAIQVCGDSMYPTYLDGEILIGTRLYRKSRLKEGDVILYKSPSEGRIVIKRIEVIRKDFVGDLQFYCLGDNRDYSHDSRYYGFVPSKNLVCKVFDQRRNNNYVCNQERRNS